MDLSFPQNLKVPFHTFQKSMGSVEPTEPTLTIPLSWVLPCQYSFDLFPFSGYARRNSLEPEIRRRTASLSTPHRASDIQVDPAHSAILFRDARAVSNFFFISKNVSTCSFNKTKDRV